MNKDKISKLGYKKNSPYKNRESLTIGSNFITTEDMAFPILAMGDGGESQVLYPNTGSYLFPNSSEVQEYKLDFNKNTNTGMKNIMANGGMMNEYDILSSYLPTLSPEDQDTFIDSYQRSNPRQKQEILMKCGGMMKYQQGGSVPMPKGMQVPREMANAEVEGGETAMNPNGVLMQFNGPSHSEGGIPTMLEGGTKVFSDHLKVPIGVQKELGIKRPNKKTTYADISKRFPTEKHMQTLADTDDKYKKNAAEIQLQKNLAMLETLFFAQEQDKMMKEMSNPANMQIPRQFQQPMTEDGLQYAQEGTIIDPDRYDFSKRSDSFQKTLDGFYYDPKSKSTYNRNEDGSYSKVYIPKNSRLNTYDTNYIKQDPGETIAPINASEFIPIKNPNSNIPDIPDTELKIKIDSVKHDLSSKSDKFIKTPEGYLYNPTSKDTWSRNNDGTYSKVYKTNVKNSKNNYKRKYEEKTIAPLSKEEFYNLSSFDSLIQDDLPSFENGGTNLDLTNISNRFIVNKDGTVVDPQTKIKYRRNSDGTYNVVSSPDIQLGTTTLKPKATDYTPNAAPEYFDALGGALMSLGVLASVAGMGASPVIGGLVGSGAAGAGAAGAGAAGAGALGSGMSAIGAGSYPVVASSLPALAGSAATGIGAGATGSIPIYSIVSGGVPGVAAAANTGLLGAMGALGNPKRGPYIDANEANYMKDLRKIIDPFSDDNIIDYIPAPTPVVPTPPTPAPVPAPAQTPAPTPTPRKAIPNFSPLPFNPVTNRTVQSIEKPSMPKINTTRAKDVEESNYPFGINPKLLGSIIDAGVVLSDRLSIDSPALYNRQKNPMFNRFYEFDNLETQRMANQQIQSIMNSNMPEQVKQAQIAQITAQSQDQQARVDFANAQRYEQKREADLAKLQSYTDANIDTRIADYDNWRQRMARVKDMQNQFKSWRKQQLVGTLKDQLGYMEKLQSLNELNPYFERSWLTGTDRYKPQRPNALNIDPTQGYDKNASRQIALPGGATATDMGDFFVIVDKDGKVDIKEKQAQKSSKMTEKEYREAYSK